MKIKSGFVMRNVCGEHVVSAEGTDTVNFSKLIVLNASGTLIWEAVQDKDFTVETVADVLCENYEVERELALKDAQAFCDKLAENGVIE